MCLFERTIPQNCLITVLMNILVVIIRRDKFFGTVGGSERWEKLIKTNLSFRGLDESHFRKLFLRRNVMLLRKRDLEQSKQTEPEPLTVEEVRDYDYNNENDASYCPNHLPVIILLLFLLLRLIVQY